MRIDDDLDEPLLVLKDVAMADIVNIPNLEVFPGEIVAIAVQNRKIYATKNNRWPS